MKFSLPVVLSENDFPTWESFLKGIRSRNSGNISILILQGFCSVIIYQLFVGALVTKLMFEVSRVCVAHEHTDSANSKKHAGWRQSCLHRVFIGLVRFQASRYIAFHHPFSFNHWMRYIRLKWCRINEMKCSCWGTSKRSTGRAVWDPLHGTW